MITLFNSNSANDVQNLIKDSPSPPNHKFQISTVEGLKRVSLSKLIMLIFLKLSVIMASFLVEI